MGRRRWGRTVVVTTLAAALLAPVGQTTVAVAEDKRLGKPDLPKPKVTKVKVIDELGAKKARDKVATDRKANAAQAATARQEQNATWPKQGTATLDLQKARSGEVSPSGVAVSLEAKASTKTGPADGQARLTVLDQKAARKAGITGVLLTATAEEAGAAEIEVDYSKFASAIGGGWAGRLRLVQLPSCVLTTPNKAECRKQTPLKSANDISEQTVSGRVALTAAKEGQAPQLSAAEPTTALAVTAAAAAGPNPNGTGNYSATELSNSSSWQAGNSSGTFTWSYGFAAPPAAAGPTPELSLSYDSGSIDGRTATTNNQGSAVGEGFGISESYIERSYGPCDKDGHADVLDHCWKYDNAQLVLEGKPTRLIKVSDSEWRLADDDASKVTRSTGADNGDDNGEHWTVITGNGTKYLFGLNKLEGAADQRTNSTWTVPVFGDDSGDPGYEKGDAFGDRALTQAWRWNLDYIEDTNGNASTYWYAKESNHYKKNKATTANASYTRGGYLKEIKYGLRKGALFTDDADAKATFEHAERCTGSDCAELTKDTAKYWPDVPFDAICSDGDTDCAATGPAFFSRKRLTGINTYSWAAGTKTYDPVDSWTLTQKYEDGGDIGDTSDHVLTLQSIKRTAKAGTDIALNPVSFTYERRPNRVDGTDDILPMKRHRISTITSETGAITTVTLSSEECKRSEVLDAAQDTNTRSCYPQYWNINGAEKASVDWFHKYRVLAVTEADPTGQNEAVHHAYEYSGAAWHHSDDPLIPKDERTWSDWRGYRQVTVHTGAVSTNRSKTVSVYMQGMDGDKKKDGTTRSVSVEPLATPSLGVAGIADSDQYAGQLRQKVIYDGTTAISAEVNEPWSKETARQTVPNAADHAARFVRTKQTTTHTYLTAAKKWRARTVATTFDDYGMASKGEDRGDDAKSGDETCQVTWYARNDKVGLTSLVSRTRAVGKSCALGNADLDLPADDSKRGDVLSDTATAYDNATWSTAMVPTKGLPTWTGRAKGYSDTAVVTWQTVSTTGYDELGRPTSVAGADSTIPPTTTAYTPATSGPLTKTIATGPTGLKKIDYLDGRRGQALRSFDANMKKTELAYDALGRLTDVWLPNRDRAANYSPSSKFAYHMDNKKQSWVSTSVLKKDGQTYNTSYQIFDALLRPLQTQAPTPQGGRRLTDTRYDTRGLVYEQHADIFDTTSTPNGVYARAAYGKAPNQTETTFDGAGRPVTSTLLVGGVEKWSTSTSYTGDSTATSAVAGGSATRSVTDARGRTIETREYAGKDPADAEYGGSLGAPFTSTTFGFTLDDQALTVTGPDQAKWTYTYDLYGRLDKTSDPDKGTTDTDYNVLDQPIKSTNAESKSILTEYDKLGRVTATWAGTKSDATQLTGYTYDTLLKGLPSTSTRYVGGKSGRAYTQSVTAYDSLAHPTATKLELPADDPFVKAGAPQTLEYSGYYNIDGTLQNSKEPALGGLPSEIVEYGYNGLGQPTTVGGSTGYLLDTHYTPLGQADLLTLGTANTEETKKSYLANLFEEGTGRLTRSYINAQAHTSPLQDLNYTYDQTGNVTSIADTATLGGGAETQCFAYDGHRRLTEAWTPSSQKCSDGRNANSLSGPAPYWTSYNYNNAGQRTRETAHKTSGDTTTTYCYKGSQPHFLTGTSSKADCTNPDRTYTPDKTGNTTKRPGTSAAQDLLWSEEGKLSKLTESGKATDYLYGPDGTLLIRSSQGGERILYAGATELHLEADGSTWAQRYYSAGGQPIAVRTNETGENKLTYLAGDHHGTQSLAITADNAQTPSKRYMSPFGAERGKPTGNAWPDDKGFLGKTNDTTTGLTHIGAREYDPSTGQFISVDPFLETDKAQTLNGYSYAAQNPLTFSDPTGERLACGGAGQEGCPRRPDGTPGNGRMNEGVDYTPSKGRLCYRFCGQVPWQLEGGTASDLNNDGYVALLPGVTIPDGWADQKKFIEIFYSELNKLTIYGINFYAEHQDVAYVQGDISAALRDACYETGCPSFDHYFRSWAGVNAVAGISEGGAGARGGKSKTGKRVPGVICNKCFLAGTDVLLANGETKDIEDVKAGDEVLATDPETGESGPREVTRLIITEDDKKFNKLSIATKEGTEALIATYEHPFWSPSEKAWVEAAQLEPGMTLRTSEGGNVAVTGNNPFTKHARTYNLTVDDLHTYYVLAGVTPVLVHNCGGDLNARGGIYTLRDADDNVVRTGRTNDLQRREREHARADSTADYRFQVEYRTDIRNEQRGLEQIVWMLNGRPTLPGVRRTAGVNVRNRNYNKYMDAAGRFFAKWYPGQGG